MIKSLIKLNMVSGLVVTLEIRQKSPHFCARYLVIRLAAPNRNHILPADAKRYIIHYEFNDLVSINWFLRLPFTTARKAQRSDKKE